MNIVIVIFVIVNAFYSPSCHGLEMGKELSVFEFNCHLPICLPLTTDASIVPLVAEHLAEKLSMPIFHSLWFAPTMN